MFQYVESRWQIAILILIAALIEFTANDRGERLSKGRFLMNSAAAAIAITLMKWHIEGFNLS